MSLTSIITDADKDPLGCMVADHLSSGRPQVLDVESTTLEMWQMSSEAMFRTYPDMHPLEQKALSLCTGNVLDIGAGAGCHALYLQKKGFNVHAIDISPGCVHTMQLQGISHVSHTNLYSLRDREYDTLLMLMNGIGICGSLDGLNLFFQQADNLLSPAGQILADSTDLEQLYFKAALEKMTDDYFGQTRFKMIYKQITGDPFDWIYIDFDTLSYYAGLHGFQYEKIFSENTGKYLARIFR